MVVNRFIVEQRPLQPSAIGEDDVSPLVITAVIIPVGWGESFDTNKLPQLIATDDGLLSFEMTGAANCSPVGKVVATVRPQPSFDDVMGVLAWMTADDAIRSIALQN